MAAGIVDRVCWVVPRDSLRLQAEEAFADPVWRAALGHALSVRAAENAPDPSRGLAGYITTYQAVAAGPDLHLREIRRHRTLLVVDEVHHLPALAEVDPEAAAQEAATGEDQASAWSRAILPLLECAAVRLLLSGTLERADGKGILWLPYRKGPKARTREVELDAPGWAVIGYSRAQALREKLGAAAAADPALRHDYIAGWLRVAVSSKPSDVRNLSVGCSPEWKILEARTGRPSRSSTARSTSRSLSGCRPAARSSIRIVPCHSCTRVSPTTQ